MVTVKGEVGRCVCVVPIGCVRSVEMDIGKAE